MAVYRPKYRDQKTGKPGSPAQGLRLLSGHLAALRLTIAAMTSSDSPADFRSIID